ncbi:MAG: arylesterase [Pseudomonadota bacterium]
MLLPEALRGQTEHGSSLRLWPQIRRRGLRELLWALSKKAARILPCAPRLSWNYFKRGAVRAVAINAYLICLGLLSPSESAAESNSAEPVATQTPPTVLVLGDSISAAYGMALEQGWVELTERRLQQEWPELEIVNASISGDTSAGGLRRLPALLKSHAPDLVVIELGGNDGLRGYPVPELESNLTKMATLAREAGSQALILPMEIPPNYGPRYTSAFRNSFINASNASGAALGRFLLDDVATDAQLMQDDGIHPTIEAQPLIADVLEADIRRLLQAALDS